MQETRVLEFGGGVWRNQGTEEGGKVEGGDGGKRRNHEPVWKKQVDVRTAT